MSCEILTIQDDQKAQIKVNHIELLMERARLGSKVILKNTGNTEISHFGHLGCEKIKFEVDR